MKKCIFLVNGYIIFILSFSSQYALCQNNNLEYLNSDWWLLHGKLRASLQFSYLSLKGEDFTFCIERGNKMTKINGKIKNVNDTLLMRIEGLSDLLTGFWVDKSEIYPLPELKYYLNSKGLNIFNNTMYSRKNYLSNRDYGSRRILIKKMEYCLAK